MNVKNVVTELSFAYCDKTNDPGIINDHWCLAAGCSALWIFVVQVVIVCRLLNRAPEKLPKNFFKKEKYNHQGKTQQILYMKCYI